jgi:hypothetical protein
MVAGQTLRPQLTWPETNVFSGCPSRTGWLRRLQTSSESCFAPRSELRRRNIDLSHIGVDQAAILKQHVSNEIVRLLYRQKGPLAILRTMADSATNLGSPLSNAAAHGRGVWAPLARMVAWPPVIEHPVVAPNGLWIVPLSSTTAIFAEGRTMQHCIGQVCRSPAPRQARTFSTTSMSC